jgi:ABC-2 type transport system permease protein
MAIFLALVRRELGGAFKSLVGYIVISVVLLEVGFSLLDLIKKLGGQPADVPLTQLFYQSVYFWITLLTTTPIITMRSFAAERSSGTYEALMTTPVGDLSVVFAKYVGGMLFYLFTWLPFLAVLAVLRNVSHESAFLDPRTTGGAFLGIFLIGSLYISMGCFASALTRSQMIAAILSFLLGVGLWIVSLRPSVDNPLEGRWGAVLDHLSITRHMYDFAAGIIDSRHVVFYVSGTVLFLFLTTRVVESRRWN